MGCWYFDGPIDRPKGCLFDSLWRRSRRTILQAGRALPFGNVAPKPPMGYSAVTSKINRGSHFPDCEENTSMIRWTDNGEGIPASRGVVCRQVKGASQPSDLVSAVNLLVIERG